MPINSQEDVSVISIQKLIRLMEELGVAQSKDLVGVKEREIRQLETHFGLKFPKAYKQFLTQFGRSAGYLSPWMAIYFDDLKEIREMFDMSLAQGLSYRLPAKALLIANFDSTFDFIECDGEHDPKVFRVDLRRPEPAHQQYAPGFSSYLETLARNSDITAIPADLCDDVDEVFDDLMNY